MKFLTKIPETVYNILILIFSITAIVISIYNITLEVPRPAINHISLILLFIAMIIGICKFIKDRQENKNNIDNNRK